MRYFFVMLLLMLFVGLSSVLFDSCRKGDTVSPTTPIAFEFPSYFPQPVYSFQSAPVTKEGFELGRRLFYEGRLSKDGNYSCASCHQQIGAFTTYDHDLSHGYGSSHTLRNAPGLANLAWQKEYNLDGSAKNLDALSLAHITAPTEMGETMEGVLLKLKGDTAYKRLFRAAYGDEGVTSPRLLNALTQFVINLVSSNSKYDRMMRGEVTFTAAEGAGYALFKSTCATCHAGPLFTDYSYRNIGLALNPAIKDYGRMKVTSDRKDSLKFRVPSLRNVAATGTYSHDGRLGTLRNVLDHYRTGVVQSATLDPLLTNGIPLTNAQVDDLILFLKTLTDSSYLANPRFGGG